MLKPGNIVYKLFEHTEATRRKNFGKYGIMEYLVVEITEYDVHVRNSLGHPRVFPRGDFFPVYETYFVAKVALKDKLEGELREAARAVTEARYELSKFKGDYPDV
jgi:hypothetical protein